jgi:hypothetical protein
VPGAWWLVQAYDALGSEPLSVAIAALDKLAARDIATVRNISAFFMAQLRSVSGWGGLVGTQAVRTLPLPARALMHAFGASGICPV